MSKIEKLHKVFNDTLNVFEKHFKLKADYTPTSLKDLEEALDHMYPKGTMAAEATLVTTGYYVGEVFIRNIPGAAWDEEILGDKNPFAVTFKLKDGEALMVCATEMVADYIRHPGNSISRLFAYYKGVAEGTREIDDNLAGTTYTKYGKK